MGRVDRVIWALGAHNGIGTGRKLYKNELMIKK
jgi:hypothetical protein